MRKYLLLICLCILLFPFSLKSQKVIKGTSPVQSFTMQSSYERGLPPNLFAELQFYDKNGNGIIESEETAKLILKLSNKGDGVAQGLEINVIEQLTKDTAFHIKNSNRIVPYLHPGKSIELEFGLKAGFNIKTAEHKLKISVLEHFGYDMDPAYLLLNTLEYQEPKLVFAGYEVVDYGEGTSSIIQDGRIQPGEWVKLKMLVQNTGKNIATNVTYKVECKDENIYMAETQGELADIEVGEVKHFWLTVSPNKRIDSEKSLPLYITFNLDLGIGGLTNYPVPVAMNHPPPAISILEVKTDWEKLQKQAARFEFSSNKFVTKIDSIIDIREILPSKTIRNEAIAIIFGIESYDELPPAPYAENDARLMKEYFQNSLGIRRIVVYNSNMSRGLIFDDVFNPGYGELQKEIIKGQTDVFLYYSGHGIPSKEGEQLFLFPSDGKKERLELQGYNLSALYENLEKLGARSVMVFLDACFSGASRQSERIKPENLVAMKGIRIKPDLYKPWEDNPNFSVFTSSGPGETSLAFDISQTGLFTYYLCAGLQGNADADKDRKITSGELYKYVRDNVTNISKKISGIQTPEFHGNENTILVEY